MGHSDIPDMWVMAIALARAGKPDLAARGISAIYEFLADPQDSLTDVLARNPTPAEVTYQRAAGWRRYKRSMKRDRHYQ